MADLQQLERALINADAAGDVEAARTLAAEVRRMRSAPAEKKPEGSLVGDIGRQLGLTARAGITGLASLPAMAGDALNAGVNLVLPDKYKLQPASSSLQNVMSMAGLPKPENSSERIAQDVASALSGVGGSVGLARNIAQNAASPVTRAVSSTLASSPNVQASGALAGATASGYAREEGASPEMQMLAGLGAGVLSPGGSSAAGTVSRGAKSLAAPVTAAGRRQIVGKVLRDFATDPVVAAKNMQEARELVPGSVPTISGASRDLGLAQLENGVIRGFDERNLLGQRKSENNIAQTQYLDDKFGGPLKNNADLRDKVKTIRDEAADEQLSRIWPTSKAVSPDPIIARIQDLRQSARGSNKAARSVLDLAEKELAALGPNANNPQFLYDGLRKTLYDKKTNQLDNTPLSENAKALLDDVIKTVDRQIESGAPGYKNYLTKFAKQSSAIEKLATMENLRVRGLSNVGSDTAGNPWINDGFAGIVRSPLVQGKMKDNNFSRGQIEALNNVGQDVERNAFASGKGVRTGGSDTFRNLSMANLVSSVANKGLADSAMPSWMRPLGLLYTMPEQQIRQLLVEAASDPKLAAGLLAEVGPRATEGLAQEIKRKTTAGLLGGTIGGQP